MAGPCSVSGAVLLLLLTAAPRGAAGYGPLRTSQNGRFFKGVRFVYEGEKTTRDSDLPPCPAATSVCSLVHNRFWLPKLSQRLCRCHEGQCPYTWSDDGDENTLRLNNRIQMKFCDSVRALRRCDAHPAVAAIQERHRETGPLTPGRERRDVRVNCSCPYPSLHQKIPRSISQGNTEVTAYTCRQLEPCGSDEACGYIRMDTYSTYHTCLCPPEQLCLFHEQRRIKEKRHVEQLFYHGQAYVGECRTLRR